MVSSLKTNRYSSAAMHVAVVGAGPAGLLFSLLAADTLIHYRLRWKSRHLAGATA